MYISLRSILLLAACFTAAYADTCYNPFNNGDLSTGFAVQDGSPYPSPYACTPKATNVVLTGGEYTLSVDPTTAVPTCALMIAQPEVSFGYYECEMRVSGVAGTITTCQVASSTKANYESVYFKFIGNDTKHAYTGYYSSGKSNPTGPVALTFSAKDDFHKYGFEWTSGYIKWYVDGAEVTSALGGKPIPSTPNYLYVSVLTESATTTTDDSLLPTDPSVDRTFTGLDAATAVLNNISYTPVIFNSCDNSTGILPGDNGYVPWDPSQCDLRSPFSIYADSIAKGWTTTGSTTNVLTSTDPRRTGTSAIRWDFLPMTARLYFLANKTFDSSDYYSFEFWVYGNGKNGQQIGIKMLFDDAGNPSTITVPIGDVLDEGVQSYEWSRAVVPFSLFGVNPNISQQVKGFVLSSTSNVFGGSIAIDDVQLGYELPMCANKTKNLYSEGLAKGVSDKSWGQWELTSNVVAHAGTYSIQWNMYGSGGIHLISSSPVLASDYQGISFWLDTASLQGQDWTVAVTSPNGDPANNLVTGVPLYLTKYYGGPIPQQSDQWSYIVIPLYQFGITPATKVDGIVFQLQSDEYQGTMYIDDINFVGQEQASTKKTNSATAISAGLVGIFATIAVLLL